MVRSKIWTFIMLLICQRCEFFPSHFLQIFFLQGLPKKHLFSWESEKVDYEETSFVAEACPGHSGQAARAACLCLAGRGALVPCSCVPVNTIVRT